MFDKNVWIVLVAAGLTAVATGLGAVPFLFLRDINRWWVGVFNATAAGLMLGASHSLVSEGFAINTGRTLGGILLGLGAIVVANKLVQGRDVDVAELHGANAQKALLILGVMTAHSFAEGVGVGVSFGGGDQLGLFITAAIAVHNIPEGLAIRKCRASTVWPPILTEFGPVNRGKPSNCRVPAFSNDFSFASVTGSVNVRLKRMSSDHSI